ncbi:hypothetical protein KRR40_01740 [Niabella defluvii]|nr:hypothetical protein KRR40_01740 [Niabella sp. I65]
MGTEKRYLKQFFRALLRRFRPGVDAQLGGYRNRAVLLSYFGRAEYSYDDKYLVNVVVRRDGSSRLGKGLKWGNFPVSAAWRISKEGFLTQTGSTTLK